MFVKDWMKKDVITVEESCTVLDAMHIMRENNIRRLPVLKNGKLVGIITEKDIKGFAPYKASTLDIYEVHKMLSKTLVREVMTREVITVSPEDTIERAALILRDMRFGGLPVVEKDDKIVGIITAVDIFDVFVEAMGMRKPGFRINITTEDKPEAIPEIAMTLKTHALNIISLVTFFFKDKDESKSDIVIRVTGTKEQVENAVEELKGMGHDVSNVLYMEGKIKSIYYKNDR
jgi:acetoin utilization protein AcuB